MKKTLLFLGCIALFAASCNKIDTVEEPVQDSPRHLKVNITVNNAETRAVKTAWAAGDKIYVVFDVCFQEEMASYLTLTYNGYSWSSEFSDDTLEELLLGKEVGKLAAAYISPDRNPEFQYVFDPENPYVPYILMTNSDGLTGMFLSSHDMQYVVEDGTLTAELNMKLRINNPVHFFVDGIPAGAVKNFTLSCNKLIPAHFDRFTYLMLDIPGSNYHSEAGPWTDYTYGLAGDPILGQYFESGVEFNCMLDTPAVGNETEYVFFVVDNNGTPNDTTDDTTYSLTRTATLNGKEAIRLPWLGNTDEWKVLTPSDLNPEFNGYDDEVRW